MKNPIDRRCFLQVAGAGAVVAVTGRSALPAPALAPETSPRPPVKRLPARSEVPVADTWDLSSLFARDEAWEEAFAAWQKEIERFAAFQGKLAESPQTLAACLKFNLDVDRAGEGLGNYAMLRATEDQGDSVYQRMTGRFTQVASRMAQASSFIQPEILAAPAEKMEQFLLASELAPYKLLLTRILRMKPHTLGEKEERLLAMQTEMAQAATQIFRQLNDTDLKFGTIEDEHGRPIELSHATFSAMLYCPERKVRANAFHTYYAQYTAHEHALAATLGAAFERDIYYSRARNYRSALESALFPDQVPVAVYDNLIAAIHKQLPALHHYYDVRRRKMGLSDIHMYDTYVPILAELKEHHTFDQAIEVVLAALAPLGSEYGAVLGHGLKNRWCDRYENRGKQSGAFSSGSYDGNPYILMNFQTEVLNDVFTLAHEGGHSMHSYFSSKNQPYAYHDYSLVVAEVASTFNETLLSNHLLKNARDKRQRAFLLNREIDAIRSTIFRQTMFAEFEKLAHASVEAGEPATLDRLKELYHGLLASYFGPEFKLDPELDLECLRIPHFYRTFYVYKYATGMSAAIALATRVTNGGPGELADYLNFLKGGCSKDPLDLLRDAGADLEKPECVERAMERFTRNVNELDSLI